MKKHLSLKKSSVKNAKRYSKLIVIQIYALIVERNLTNNITVKN